MFSKLMLFCLVSIGMPVLAFLLGCTLKKYIPESKLKERLQLKSKGLLYLFWVMFCCICLYRTTNMMIWLAVLNFPVVMYGYSTNQPLLPSKGEMKLNASHILWLVAFLLTGVTYGLIIRQLYWINWLDGAMIDSNRISILWMIVLIWILVYLITTFFVPNKIINRVLLAVLAFTWVLVVLMKFLWKKSFINIVEIEFLSLFADQVILLNIGILFAVSLMFFTVFGKNLGIVLNTIFYAFLFISNFVKLRFHDTYFTWFDLLQLKEFFLIGKEFLTVPIVAGMVAVVAAFIFLIVRFNKQIRNFLKFKMYIIPAVASIVLLGGIYTRISIDEYSFLDIYKRTWENESINVRLNGLVVNLVLNFNALQEIVMDEPIDYNENTANEMLAEFETINVPAEDVQVKPDVILVLAESLFDMDGVEGLEFDKDIDATMDAYSTASMISQRYGGYTSAMEFEALTGLTLAFMPPSLTPFTTYFNNAKDDFPGAVQEFKKNGYSSVVIHPNMAEFYNRIIAYDALGFDEYQAIETFEATEENITANGWIKDDVCADRIISELEESTDPKFVYLVTMESHYVNVDKYVEPEVHATSDYLDEEILGPISQQATSYYYTDQMIQKLIDYVDNADRPTLLYVFGDHLPPIDGLGQLGYLDTVEGKYKTSLLMHSNYKELSAGTEFITPNQLAAQMVIDAGISHNSYFDYIYEMRKAYPVVHPEVILVDGNQELDKYRFIQYDLLFGKRYFIE